MSNIDQLSWIDQVESFWVDPESPQVNTLQRDGATAIIDLATQYLLGACDLEGHQRLCAHVVGRLSDIQVRDFALGSHTSETADTYYLMWRDLLLVAPRGFVAPVACLYASMAYERGEDAVAHNALDRALIDDPGYSLAQLLRRVFIAGWPAESFSAMRRELHPKVVAGIFG
jgi:hypothetical protein